MPPGLLCIETKESRRRYTVVSPYGDGGVLQYQPATWDNYGGYARAELAPPAVQEERGLTDYNRGPAVRHQLWPHTSLACGV
jgi:Transglycosylase-like domain